MKKKEREKQSIKYVFISSWFVLRCEPVNFFVGFTGKKIFDDSDSISLQGEKKNEEEKKEEKKK